MRWRDRPSEAVSEALRGLSQSSPKQSLASETASDCFGKGLSVPQRLLGRASHAISPRALPALCFYDRSKLLFGTLKSSYNPPQRLRVGRPLTPSHALCFYYDIPRSAFCFGGDYFACQLCCAHGHPAAVLCLTRIRPELCADNTVVWHSGHLCRYCRVPPQTLPSFT